MGNNTSNLNRLVCTVRYLFCINGSNNSGQRWKTWTKPHSHVSKSTNKVGNEFITIRYNDDVRTALHAVWVAPAPFRAWTAAPLRMQACP